MMSPVVLVTGAAGFVGSHLVELLAANQDEAEVIAWRRSGPRSARPRPPRPSSPSRVRWIEVDLLDALRVRDVLADIRPREIYHLAGIAAVQTSWRAVVPTLEGNVRATDHLLGAMTSIDLSARVLIPGSALVYRASSQAMRETDALAPTSPYALSKLAQEMLARQYVTDGVDVVLTRSFTHVGPGQEPAYAASSFAQQIASIEAGYEEPVIKVGFLGAQRDLLDVRDTVRAYQAIMKHGVRGQVYNVCSGRARSIDDVLHTLLRMARVPVTVEESADRLRPHDASVLLGSPQKIRAEIGWQPNIPFQQTVADLLDSWRGAVHR